MKKLPVVVCAALFSMPCLAQKAESDACVKKRQDSASRFTVKGGEVTDTRTGIVWWRCYADQKWDDKEAKCVGASTPTPSLAAATSYVEKNHSGWRLPRLDELGSLVDADCANVFDPKLFPAYASGAPLWTATQMGPDNAYQIDSGGRAKTVPSNAQDSTGSAGMPVRLRTDKK
jgi:hypothetical protein